MADRLMQKIFEFQNMVRQLGCLSCMQRLGYRPELIKVDGKDCCSVCGELMSYERTEFPRKPASEPPAQCFKCCTTKLGPRTHYLDGKIHCVKCFEAEYSRPVPAEADIVMVGNGNQDSSLGWSSSEDSDEETEKKCSTCSVDLRGLHFELFGQKYCRTCWDAVCASGRIPGAISFWPTK